MPKYLFSWEETTTLNLVIEADSYEEASEKFSNGEYDYDDISDVNTWFSNGPDIEEI